MEYRILGPLSVRAGGQELHLGGHKQRRMLALLLLRPNRPVEIGELAAVGWDDDVPHAGRRQVQNAIAALRAVLTRAGGIIDTVDGGYLLRVGPDELDVLVFERMVRHARTVTDFRAALDLWRGPALAGLAGGALAEEARRLDESRLAALEDRLDLELAAGQHESLVDELQHLVAAHPLRERLVGQLMLALHRCGRATEAAAAYEELSARLAEELGIDPGTEIRRVQASLDTSGRQAAPRPAQLPADVSVFTGRISDLTRLDALLAAGESAGAVVVAAIVGTAGLGKSALAVHWAHRVRDRFPDGQLHVNLRGYAPTAPVRPLDALARFLRALGVAPDAIPTELDAAVTLYRSILTGKRVLVVLDNASTADQIRPLLPANPASMALVTSRDQLSELVDGDGAHRLTLDRLTADEAVELLARILGAERLGADDRGAERLGADDHGAELARLCAYLPLALRIAAANLADQPSLAVADYVAKLRGGDRLTALQIEGDPRAAVRATIDLSYAARPEPVRRLLRLLALAPGPDVTPESAAAVADLDTSTAEQLLGRLAGAHLLERPAPGRFAFHDLLRLYATERAEAEETEGERAAASRRLHDHYLHTVDAAAALLYPEKLRLPLPPRPPGVRVTGFAAHAVASSWMEAERANLVAVVRHAPPADAWLLADALRGYFWLRVNTVDWLVVANAALAAGEADAAPHARAAAHLSLGDAHWHTGRHREAIEHYTASLALSQKSGSLAAQSATLNNLAGVNWQIGEVKLAAAQLQRCLIIDRQLGRHGGLAAVQSNLAVCYLQLGRLTDVLDLLAQALVSDRELNSLVGEASTHNNFGEVYCHLGRFTEAMTHLDRALEIVRAVDDRFTESVVGVNVAAVHRFLGRHRDGMDSGRAALASAQETGDPRLVADALNIVAAIGSDCGHHDEAIERYREVVRTARLHGLQFQRIAAFIGLAQTHARLGDTGRARECLDEVLDVAGVVGYRLCEGVGLTMLGQLDLAAGAVVDAAERVERAVAIHRETGHRPGEARALLVLGEALAGGGRERDAQAAWQRALALFTAMGMPEAGVARALVRVTALT